jgi:uncharacterized protein YkwD
MPAQPSPSRPNRLRKPALAVCFAAIAATATVAPQAAMATSCPNTTQMPGEISVGDLEQATVCLVNEERTSRGLVALSDNSDLANAAQGHSAEMQQRSYFAHDSANGSPFDSRIFASGYVTPNQKGVASWGIGENLAWGSLQLGTAQALDTAWMNSPEHRANILNPTFREVGAGVVLGSPKDPSAGGVIVTHDFGFVSAARSPKKKCNKKRKSAKRCSRVRRARG